MTRRKFRKIGYVVVSLIAALVAGLSLVLSFLDWNQYRDTLSRLASEQMGMRVELAGNVGLSLFPRPGMSAETVRITPAIDAYSDQVATADKIAMHLGFASFFKGRIAVQGLELEGLNAAIEQTASGTWRVKGWPETGAENSTVELSRLGVSNGRLVVAPYGEQPRHIEGLDLQFSGALPNGPLEWAGNFILDGQKIQTKGRLKPVLVRDEVSIKADIQLEESDFSVSGRLAENGDITARLVADGEELGDTIDALSVIFGEPKSHAVMPNIPFALDLQFDQNGNVARLVSRSFTLAETQGRIDLTVAKRDNYNHMAGSVSLGVIDLDAWKAALRDEEPVDQQRRGAEGTPSQPRLGGAVDLTVEGIRMQGGLGQRIDAVVAFKNDGPTITSLQALLPGAATLAFAGELKAEKGHGKVRLNIGNLTDLTKWVGISTPDVISASRMSTASADVNIEYKDSVWALTDVHALIDASKIEGEVSGDFSSFLPSHAKLVINTFNLDAFSFANNMDSPDESVRAVGARIRVPEGMDISLDITSDKMHGFGALLGKVRFVGVLKPDRLDIDFVELKQDAGTMRIEGRLANLENDLAIELAASFDHWPMPLAQYFVPDLQRYLVAANIGTLNGTASVTGAQSKMRLGLDAASEARSVSLSGEVGFPEGRLTFVNLQGGLKHENLAGPARLAGIGDYRQLPAQLTFSLSKAGLGEVFEAKIGGDLAGGKMQTEISYLEQLRSVALSFDHENVGKLAALTDIQLIAFDPTKGIRAEFTAAWQDGGWLVNIPRLKNGNRAVSGSISLDADNRFQGQLALSEIDLSEPKEARQPQAGNSAAVDALRKLADYAGSLSLSLDNVSYAGQRTTAPKANFSVGDGSARLSSGEGAMVNGGPASFQVDAVLESALPFSVKGNLQSLEMHHLLASKGLAPFVTSTLSGELTLEGELAGSSGLTASLKGGGKFAGGAGGLGFLSVSGLVNQLKTAKTGSGFLSNISDLLRGGETPFSSLETQFTLDGGVLLVEFAEAKGDWGTLSLDGQVNLGDRFLNMKGALALAEPVDAPPIPVRYEGPFDAPGSHWVSRAFESFAIAGIERRLRADLFREMEARQAQGDTVVQNPGLAVFSRAIGLLNQLKDRQVEQKRLEAEAALKAEEVTSPATGEQTP